MVFVKRSKNRHRRGGGVGNKAKPQKCVFCGKVVQNYFTLEMHMNSHTRERPWECSHCDATFMSYNVLIVHRNNIHYGKKFKCNLCHRLFNLASNLYSHRTRVHPDAVGGGGARAIGGRAKVRNKSKTVLNGQGQGTRSRFTPGRRGRPNKSMKEPSDEEEEEELEVEMEVEVEEVETEVEDGNGRSSGEEEEMRKTVEIESNPGTPIMTVNILSKDAVVVSKLKLPVIKIQRLPDGVWKQKLVTNGNGIKSHQNGNGFGGEGEEMDEMDGDEEEEEFELETEEEEGLEEPDDFYLDPIHNHHEMNRSVPTLLQPPVYQLFAAGPATPPSPPMNSDGIALLPHQIPPLPPFNLAFPPFPFKLHNFTVPDNTSGGAGNGGASGGGNGQAGGGGGDLHLGPINNNHPVFHHPQSCWDSSFFLHLNRYKPEDSCGGSPSETPKNNNNNNNNNEDNSKTSVKSTTSYQYVSSKFLKKKKKQRPLLKKEKISPKKKKKVNNNSLKKKSNGVGDKVKAPTTTKAEKEELIEETETGVFNCKECGKEFQIKWNLLTHLMTHTGEKPFGCYFCKMRFRQKAHMIKHIASIHRYQDQDDKKPAVGLGGGGVGVKGKGKISEKEEFSCGFCGEVYEIKVNLIKHISALHGDKLAESV